MILSPGLILIFLLVSLVLLFFVLFILDVVFPSITRHSREWGVNRNGFVYRPRIAGSVQVHSFLLALPICLTVTPRTCLAASMSFRKCPTLVAAANNSVDFFAPLANSLRSHSTARSRGRRAMAAGGAEPQSSSAVRSTGPVQVTAARPDSSGVRRNPSDPPRGAEVRFGLGQHAEVGVIRVAGDDQAGADGPDDPDAAHATVEGPCPAPFGEVADEEDRTLTPHGQGGERGQCGADGGFVTTRPRRREEGDERIDHDQVGESRLNESFEGGQVVRQAERGDGRVVRPGGGDDEAIEVGPGRVRPGAEGVGRVVLGGATNTVTWGRSSGRPHGNGLPRPSRAARSRATNVLPTLGSPSSTANRPRARYGSHNQETAAGGTSVSGRAGRDETADIGAVPGWRNLSMWTIFS